MAKKLFALEEENKDPLKENKLIIDKLIDYTKKEPSPVSITANILKERQQLKKEIQEQLGKEEPEEESKEEEKDSSETKPEENTEEKSSEEGSSDQEEKTEESSSEDKEEQQESSKEESKDESKEEEPKKDSSEEEDETEVAADKDSLKGIIGSGLTGKEPKKEETKPKEEEKKEEVSKESYSLSLSNIFRPIKNSYNSYLVSLESFNLPYKLSMEEQPIVYVKESVLESLNNLVSVANGYIAKNSLFIEKNKEAVERINKQLVILKQFVEERRYHFTMKVVDDQTLLSNVSVDRTSDIRDTIQILLKYSNDSGSLINLILNNKFEAISTSATSLNYIKKNNDFAYGKMLPGFNKVVLALDNYENYLKAKIENFQYYKVRTFKVSDLYNIEGISITEDKELDFIVDKMDKLFIELTMSLDNFNVINQNLHKLIDAVKTLIYDVEHDAKTNLADLGIDSLVKDFIKFKILSEISAINIELIMDYLLNVENVIYTIIELKK